MNSVEGPLGIQLNVAPQHRPDYSRMHLYWPCLDLWTVHLHYAADHNCSLTKN